MDINDLEPLIGRWEIPVGEGEPGETTFAWALGGRSWSSGPPCPSRARPTA